VYGSTLNHDMPHPAGDIEPLASRQTDAELYRVLRSGQTGALGVLYDRHAGLVYSIALRALGSPQEAEDLTQDIFLNLARSTAYNPDRGALRTFLAVLTRSRAIDRLRSHRTARSSLERLQVVGSVEPSGQSPLEQVFQQEQSQEVQAALAQLPEGDQRILRMAYYDGLSQSEIAERLNLPLGTVKSKARRTLLKLRQTLADHVESSHL
jgi:RNA polymerase sigma-70 factor (ECF subfamily)